jgi:hypothetical protein
MKLGFLDFRKIFCEKKKEVWGPLFFFNHLLAGAKNLGNEWITNEDRHEYNLVLLYSCYYLYRPFFFLSDTVFYL